MHADWIHAVPRECPLDVTEASGVNPTSHENVNQRTYMMFVNVYINIMNSFDTHARLCVLCDEV